LKHMTIIVIIPRDFLFDYAASLVIDDPISR
jgi:hypothetical protein